MGPGVKKKFEVDEENPAESITKAFGMFMTDSNTNVLLLSGAAGSGKSTAYAKLQTWILTTYTKMRKDEHDIDVVLLPVALSQLKNPINGIFKVEVQQICLIPNSCSARLGVCIPTLHAHCTYTRRAPHEPSGGPRSPRPKKKRPQIGFARVASEVIID